MQLYMGHPQLDVIKEKASRFRASDWSGMTFIMQKIGVPGEIEGNARRGAIHACPVVGLADL